MTTQKATEPHPCQVPPIPSPSLGTFSSTPEAKDPTFRNNHSDRILALLRKDPDLAAWIQ